MSENDLASVVDPRQLAVERMRQSPSLFAAFCAYELAIDAADNLRQWLHGGDDIVPPWRDFDPCMAEDMAAFARKIGRRCNADVMGQQLRILKHRRHAELSGPERVAVGIFISTLLDLDEFAAAEKAAIEKATAQRPAPRPLPIEDTTMEAVDGPMETW